MIRTVFILIISGFVAQSCLTEADCVTTTRDFVTVNFYEFETNERDTLLVTSITAIGSDSLLADDELVRSIRLPLDPRRPSAAYIFDSELGIDTLVLSYDLGTRLISEECGLEFVFTGLDYTRNDFDSISIVNQVPIDGVDEDIRIFN